MKEPAIQRHQWIQTKKKEKEKKKSLTKSLLSLAKGSGKKKLNKTENS